ncbi:MAG: glycosyltransferase family 39 protein [Bacteroidetes bacterium]|nr:glycosyltransferase family 39 protein [Bacteroidota bacterium]
MRKVKQAPAKTETVRTVHLPLAITVSSMVLAGIIRLRLLAIPLERDEGGFAYIGKHLFSSQLYTDLFDNKPPGLYGLYALFTSLFGYGPGGIHFGLLLCNLVAIWVIFKLFSGIFSDWTGAVAASVYAFMSLAPNVNGFAAHANQLLMPFAIGGLLLLQKGLKKDHLRSIALAGLLLGFAFIVKQQVVLYGVFAGLWLLISRWQSGKPAKQVLSEVLAYSASAILPYGLVCLYFASQGRFNDLWIWTVELPAQLGESSMVGDRWSTFSQYFSLVLAHFEVVWVAAALGWLALVFSPYDLKTRLYGWLFPVFCAVSIGIGVAYYPHYFVLCLPAVGLLCGVLADTLRVRFSEKKGNAWALGLTVLLALVPVLGNASYYLSPDFVKIHRDCYNMNPFPELEKVGRELGRRCKPGDKIGILGSEPEILVYAKRNAASGHLFLYNLLSQGPRSEALQQRYLSDLQKNKPAYLVWVTSTGSWGTEYYKTAFFNNTRPIVQGYTLCGKAEAFEDGRPGVVVWDQEAARYQFKGNYQVYVYRRRE